MSAMKYENSKIKGFFRYNIEHPFQEMMFSIKNGFFGHWCWQNLVPDWFKTLRHNTICFFQRHTNRFGITRADLWSVDYTIVEFLYEILTRFKEKDRVGVPNYYCTKAQEMLNYPDDDKYHQDVMNLGNSLFDKDLESLISKIKTLKERDCHCITTEDEERITNEMFAELRKIFYMLWD